jgi:hypothetical protein
MKINTSKFTEKEMDIWKNGIDYGLAMASNIFLCQAQNGLGLIELKMEDKDILWKFVQWEKRKK